MKMITTCPACGTSFRVHRDQIDARGGQVRCGHCSVVFDANIYLEVEAEHSPPMPIESIPPPDELDEAAPEAASAEEETLTETVEENETTLLEELGFKGSSRPRSRLATTLWSLAVLVSGLLLIGQLAFYFRSELAVRLPQLQPLLHAACDALGCVVALPQQAELISIEADDMQVDRSQANLLTLSAVLRNRADFDQAYPAIELTLTDEAQTTVSRRLLRPVEYLSEPLRHSHAFAANSEIALKLYIQTGDLNATGYRMWVLYP